MGKTAQTILWIFGMCVLMAIVISPPAGAISFVAVTITYFMVRDKEEPKKTKNLVDSPNND